MILAYAVVILVAVFALVSAIVALFAMYWCIAGDMIAHKKKLRESQTWRKGS